MNKTFIIGIVLILILYWIFSTENQSNDPFSNLKAVIFNQPSKTMGIPSSNEKKIIDLDSGQLPLQQLIRGAIGKVNRQTSTTNTLEFQLKAAEMSNQQASKFRRKV